MPDRSAVPALRAALFSRVDFGEERLGSRERRFSSCPPSLLDVHDGRQTHRLKTANTVCQIKS
jgi:hypothetical protein